MLTVYFLFYFSISTTKKTLGKIHSFESFGTLDGPGINFVVFMAGCPLLCKYCHNIDVVCEKTPKKYSAIEILSKIKKNKPYLDASGGGVTISGGDPFFQLDFLLDFLKKCKKNKFHTTIDTSLCTSKENIDKVLPYTDLFMVSLKHFDNNVHEFLTGVSNAYILENIRYLSKKKVRLWLRYLVLPGYTDTKKNLKELLNFTKKLKFECIELLPYHTMGVDKWNKLGLKYELNRIKPPKLRSLLKIKKMLEKEGIKVVLNQ